MLIIRPGFFLGTSNAEVCDGGDACCTSRPEKCGIDEGDCDDDAECAGNLICGQNNCGGRPGFDDTDDCCEIGNVKFFIFPPKMAKGRVDSLHSQNGPIQREILVITYDS